MIEIVANVERIDGKCFLNIRQAMQQAFTGQSPVKGMCYNRLVSRRDAASSLISLHHVNPDFGKLDKLIVHRIMMDGNSFSRRSPDEYIVSKIGPLDQILRVPKVGESEPIPKFKLGAGRRMQVEEEKSVLLHWAALVAPRASSYK